jgi:hypothetical protein
LEEGDLLVTEVMVNPVDCTSDAYGEYVEVYNNTEFEVDLVGLKMAVSFYADAGTFAGGTVGPGEYAVGSRQGFENCYGIEPDFTFNKGLNNAGGDMVRLYSDNGTLDIVDFRGWTIPAGASLELNAAEYDATSNDEEANWCEGVSALNEGADTGSADTGDTGPDLGSPGTANDCGVTDTGSADTGDSGTADTGTSDTGTSDTGTSDTGTSDTGTSDTAVTTVSVTDLSEGDLLITELMIDPVDCTSEPYGEYIEVFNNTEFEVELTGLKVADSGGTGGAFDAETVAPGGYAVGTRRGFASCYGIDPDFTFSRGLNNAGGDSVTLYTSSGTLDVVDYRGWTVPAGASLELNAAAYDSTSNDDESKWCEGASALDSSADLGSPGTANDCGSGATGDTGTADTGTADTGTADTGTADTGTSDTGTDDIDSGADLAAGEAVYMATCGSEYCHGYNGVDGSAPDHPDVIPELSDEELQDIILNGTGVMGAQILTDQELEDVMLYLRTTFQ